MTKKEMTIREFFEREKKNRENGEGGIVDIYSIMRYAADGSPVVTGTDFYEVIRKAQTRDLFLIEEDGYICASAYGGKRKMSFPDETPMNKVIERISWLLLKVIEEIMNHLKSCLDE